MKPVQLGILAGLLAAGAGTYFYLQGKKEGNLTTPPLKGKLLFEALSYDDVASLTIKTSKAEVTAKKEAGKWVLPARDGFPAMKEAVDGLLDNVVSLRVQDTLTIGPSQFGRLQIKAPGDGGTTDETGVAVSLAKADGSEVASFVLGKTETAASGGYDLASDTRAVDAQWVLVKGIADAIQTKSGFSRTDADVRQWLDKSSFFSVSTSNAGNAEVGIEKNQVKSVTVTLEKPEDSWKLFREKADDTDVKLADTKEGEEFDPPKGSAAGSYFSSTSFLDVATAAEKDKTGMDKPAATAVIETFDGFTYTVKVGGVAPKANDTDAEDNRYMSVAVDAKFPEARTLPAPKEDGKPAETDEDKKRKDELFTTEVTKLKERLAKQQAMTPYTFVVSKFVVDPLLKKRSELMKDKAAPAADTPAADIPTPPDGSGDAALMKATSGESAKPIIKSVPNPPPAAGGAGGAGKGATAVTPAIEVQPDGKTRVVTEEEMKKAAEEAKAKGDTAKEEPKKDAPKDDAPKADAPKKP